MPISNTIASASHKSITVVLSQLMFSSEKQYASIYFSNGIFHGLVDFVDRNNDLVGIIMKYDTYSEYKYVKLSDIVAVSFQEMTE